MTMTTTGTDIGTTLAAFEAAMEAQITDAEKRIETFEAKAKEKRLQAELITISALKAGRQNLEQKLAAFKTQQTANITRTKTEIDVIALALKQSLDELARKLETPIATK